MALIAFAARILPGQSEAVGKFGDELDERGFRDRYNELNRLASITRHFEWVESLPGGDVLIVVYESADPMSVGRSFIDGDPYDDWWRARVKRIHGFDPADGGVAPTLTWSWTTDRS